MNSKLSICVITGSRADYSHLFMPMKCIKSSDLLTLQLVITGMHLSSNYGNTVEFIEKDGFTIDAKIPMLDVGNDEVAVTKSIGNAVIGFADAFKMLSPDVILVLGDRFETLAAVQSALIAKIPVAHIGGGDITEGAFDDAIRHSITKMSHIHFVTNEGAKDRVLQMGENPEHVHLTGSPALDIINDIDFVYKNDFFNELGLPVPYTRYVLVTYHPETLAQHSASSDAMIITDVLGSLTDAGIIITGANADTGGKAVNAIFQDFANINDHCVFHMSLGNERFYNAFHHVDIFIGNSSSGLYEAPSFKLPVVNIGGRQSGRICAESVINCALDKEAIIQAMECADKLDCSNVINPYSSGNASEQIVNILSQIKEPKTLLKKKFYNCGYND